VPSSEQKGSTGAQQSTEDKVELRGPTEHTTDDMMQCAPSIMWGPHARPEMHLQEALPYATADLTLRVSTPSNRHTEQRTIARVVKAHTEQGARHRAHCALAEHSNPNRAQITECIIICNAPPVMELRVKYPGLTCTNGRDSQPMQPPDRPSRPPCLRSSCQLTVKKSHA
jgi:hypothetical protein